MRRAVVVGIVLTVLVTTVSYRVASSMYFSDVFTPMPGASLASTNLHVGTVFNYGVQFQNNTRDRTLIVRIATLPHSVPAHLRLVHQMIVGGGGFIATSGWPPQEGPHNHFPTRSPDGFRVKLGRNHNTCTGTKSVATSDMRLDREPQHVQRRKEKCAQSDHYPKSAHCNASAFLVAIIVHSFTPGCPMLLCCSRVSDGIPRDGIVYFAADIPQHQ